MESDTETSSSEPESSEATDSEAEIKQITDKRISSTGDHKLSTNDVVSPQNSGTNHSETSPHLSKTKSENLNEQLSLSHAKIIEQKEEIIELKSEKVSLLKQIRELCVSLEKKGKELDEVLCCYDRKNLEATKHLKQVAALVEELEVTSGRLRKLEDSCKCSRVSEVSVRGVDCETQTAPPPRNCACSRLGTTSLDSGHPDSTNSLHTDNVDLTPQVVSPINSAPPGQPSIGEDSPPNKQATKRLSSSQGPTVSRHVTRTSTILTEPGNDVASEVSRLPSFCWTTNHVTCWLSNHIHMPDACVKRVGDLGLDGNRLVQLTEKEMEKSLCICDPVIRRKLHLAVEDLRVHGPPGLPHIPGPGHIDHLWVAKTWLPKHLGLSQLAADWMERRIDGRVLSSLAGPATKKALGRLLGKLTKTEVASLAAGIELLRRFNFNVQSLEKRREQTQSTNSDPLIWTNERVGKWLTDGLSEHPLTGLNSSGLHGAYMVLDPGFSVTTLAKLLRLPGAIVRSSRLEDRLIALLKPARLNERVKVKRSSSMFSSRRRSASQCRADPSSQLSLASTGQPQLMSESMTAMNYKTIDDTDCSAPVQRSTPMSASFIRGYRSGSSSAIETDQQPQSANRIRMSFRNISRKTSASEAVHTNNNHSRRTTEKTKSAMNGSRHEANNNSDEELLSSGNKTLFKSRAKAASSGQSINQVGHPQRKSNPEPQTVPRQRTPENNGTKPATSNRTNRGNVTVSGDSDKQKLISAKVLDPSTSSSGKALQGRMSLSQSNLPTSNRSQPSTGGGRVAVSARTTGPSTGHVTNGTTSERGAASGPTKDGTLI